MFHQNVLPEQQRYVPRDKPPPWEELATAAILSVASRDQSPHLYTGAYGPMDTLIDSGHDISFRQFVWEASQELCIEALAKQRRAETPSHAPLVEVRPTSKEARVGLLKLVTHTVSVLAA